MSTNEKTNMVFIAGEIKKLTVRDDGSAFVLVDVGEDSKYIPLTVYQDNEISSQLSAFAEGQFIRIQGFCRAWSQKKDGEWRNSMDVRITHIKSKPPAPEAKPKQQKRFSDSEEVPW